MLCSVCGKDHPVENIERSFRLADAIFALPEDERETRGKIASNFCALDDDVFVRGLIPVPIKGKGDIYCCGVWAKISWDTYSELFNSWDQEDCTDLEDLEGSLANALPVYDGTVGLPVRVARQADTRPFVYVTSDQPLQRDQRDGIPPHVPIHYAHL
jgi:hypothetical protein